MTIDDVYERFREIIKNHFPASFFRSTGFSGSDFNAELAKENRWFVNTPYFYKGENEFIHWTSVDNLMSILNNREFRLYNLNSSSDEHEFAYAAEELGLDKNQIEHSKKYYYTFSFCKKSDLTNPYLWEAYGKNSTGVAIKFSVMNDPVDWGNFMMAEMQYHVPANFKAFADDINELKKQFGITTSGFNMGKLIGFHKKADFYNEHEIRIATYFPYTSYREYLKFAKTEFRIDKVNQRHRITNYISLPLWVDNEAYGIKSSIKELDRTSFDEMYFKTRPKIALKNIYFGTHCGIPNRDYQPFRNQLIQLIQLNFGYHIDLELNLYTLK